MAILTDIANKGLDITSLSALLEKLKGTYGSIQDIINAINNIPFNNSSEIDLDTTYTTKFIGENGLDVILQLIKEIKTDYESKFNTMQEQLNAMNEGLRSFSDVVEAMNEDINNLME